MTRKTRVNQTVFAGNAPQEETSVFGTMKTSPVYTTDVAASINTPLYSEGWKSAIALGYAPFIEDMNTVQRELSYQIAYSQQEGIPEWSGETTYYIGSLVKVNISNGSRVYASKTDDNIGNLVTDTNNWKLILDSSADIYANPSLSNLNSSGRDVLNSIVPTGAILPYGGVSAPISFLLCNGEAVSRTTYSALFSVIGTTYGSGDGSTTFNLPQLENIVYNIETNVPCKGNGKNIGLRSATRGALSTIQDFGLYGSQSTPMGSTVPHFNASTQAVNGVAGKQVAGTSTTVNINNYGIGLSQNAANSGIVGTVTRSILTCKYIIKI